MGKWRRKICEKLYGARRMRSRPDLAIVSSKDWEGSCSHGIAHFGKALMQSRLGSVLQECSAIQWPIRLTEADAFRTTSRLSYCVSSLIYCHEIRTSGQTDRRPGPRDVRTYRWTDIWHVCIQIHWTTPLTHNTQGERAIRDVDWIKNNPCPKPRWLEFRSSTSTNECLRSYDYAKRGLLL